MIVLPGLGSLSRVAAEALIEALIDGLDRADEPTADFEPDTVEEDDDAEPDIWEDDSGAEARG